MIGKLPNFHDGEVVRIDFPGESIVFSISSVDGHEITLSIYGLRYILTKNLSFQNIIFDIEIVKCNISNIDIIADEFDTNFQNRDKCIGEFEIYLDDKTFYVCIEPSNGLLLMALARKVSVSWCGESIDCE